MPKDIGNCWVPVYLNINLNYFCYEGREYIMVGEVAFLSTEGFAKVNYFQQSSTSSKESN